MSKMGSHDPFGYLKHKLWPKERLGVNLSIWLSITKSQESTWFPWVHVACSYTVGKLSTRATTFLQTSYQSHVYTQSYGPIKLQESQLWEFQESHYFGTPKSLGSPGTKCHLGVGSVIRHKVYYNGESDRFPQVRVVVNLVSPNLPMAHFNTKSVPAMH
jgi:hypothetical protein